MVTVNYGCNKFYDTGPGPYLGSNISLTDF
jgi:hypothetical protein